VVHDIPLRQGDPVTDTELAEIAARYQALLASGHAKGEVARTLQDEFQRGRFAIKNILDRLKADGRIEQASPGDADLVSLFWDP
jgi:hypothetical protein